MSVNVFMGFECVSVCEIKSDPFEDIRKQFLSYKYSSVTIIAKIACFCIGVCYTNQPKKKKQSIQNPILTLWPRLCPSDVSATLCGCVVRCCTFVHFRPV